MPNMSCRPPVLGELCLDRDKTIHLGTTRRRFLTWAGVAAGIATVPWMFTTDAASAPGFLSEEEVVARYAERRAALKRASVNPALSQAEREGACVINQSAALRNHPEKLAVMEFPQFVGPPLVTRSRHRRRKSPSESMLSTVTAIGYLR